MGRLTGAADGKHQRVTRPLIVGNGDCLFVVAGELVFALFVGETDSDLTKVRNAHEIGSLNRGSHFCHSDLQSSAQFLIQPPAALLSKLAEIEVRD